MYPIKPREWEGERNEYYKPQLQHTDRFYSFVKNKEIMLEDHGDQNSRKLCVAEAIRYVNHTQYAIDVGCRDGEYTRYLTRYFTHCYAFDYRYRIHFAHNVDTTRVTHFECALGEQAGTIKASGRGNIRAKKIDREWLPGAGGISIDVYKLDQFNFRDVGLLKVDVDGMDEEVLRGAQGLIRECRPVIIVEQHADSTHDAVGYLNAEFGYEIKFKSSLDWVLA